MLYLIKFMFKPVHSEEQGIILQVLAVLVTTVAVQQPLTARSPSVTCPLVLSGTSSLREPGVVLPILQLVEQAHSDGVFEGPLSIVIIVSLHQIARNSHMSACTISQSISLPL